MNRELDRQIAINFHPGFNAAYTEKLLKEGRDRGSIDNMLAWDTLPQGPCKEEFLLENGGSWSHCKDNIWATENLPHYSEDLNLAFKLPIPDFWEFQIETLMGGKTFKALYYRDKDDGFDSASAIDMSPAEAICLARLALKEKYGI